MGASRGSVLGRDRGQHFNSGGVTPAYFVLIFVFCVYILSTLKKFTLLFVDD